MDLDRAGVHRSAVESLADQGVFEGTECTPGEFCPADPVERWVVAVWLVRILDGTDPAVVSASRFADVDTAHWWARYVERLADLGVTAGCDTEPLRFCPHETVTRARMASFLVRAFKLPPASPAGFVDVAGGAHASNIDALATSGITAGCKTTPLSYCPGRYTTRAQMATFLTRAGDRNQFPTTVKCDGVYIDEITVVWRSEAIDGFTEISVNPTLKARWAAIGVGAPLEEEFFAYMRKTASDDPHLSIYAKWFRVVPSDPHVCGGSWCQNRLLSKVLFYPNSDDRAKWQTFIDQLQCHDVPPVGFETLLAGTYAHSIRWKLWRPCPRSCSRARTPTPSSRNLWRRPCPRP